MNNNNAQWVFSTRDDSIAWYKFFEIVDTRGYKFLDKKSWSTVSDYEDILNSDLGIKLFHAQGTNNTYSFYFGGNDANTLDPICYINISLPKYSEYNYVYAAVAAQTRDEIESTLENLKTFFPKRVKESDDKIQIDFWTYGKHGAEYNSRRISASNWNDIKDNYSAKTKDHIEKLMNLNKDEIDGQLILWTGKPGVGKSHCLRALAKEWDKDTHCNYIVDPDVFFGSRPDYMMEVILGGRDNDETKDKWKLLILEDTGEMLRADAKENVGQGLSRLLNVVDGLIGQGLKLLILVTTNEDISRMHEAVIRPGRCLSNIKFEELSIEESQKWAEKHDIEIPNKSYSLATLYAKLHGVDVEGNSKFGF